MKAVILAGGRGTRISEESLVRPKPLIEIGGKPIIWHIMKNYSHYGINEFIICCGYKAELVKEYFANYSPNHFVFFGKLKYHPRGGKTFFMISLGTRLELFKKYLVDNKLYHRLYKPQNQKECDRVIELILSLRK